MFKLVLEKAETRDQIANIRWITEKAREFQKNIYFCFIDYAKAFDCVDHNKLWKIRKEMGVPDHLTCLLRNLSAGQEATVRTGHGTTDWYKIGKGVRQGCILSPCLFNFYAEYIMRNTRLEEAQAGIQIARRNINNLRYADDTTLMAESDQIRSVTQSCPTLCNPMNRSMPGLPVHHQLPEFTQTHVHRVSDAIQPSHPLSSPSPPAPNPSQHQGLFQ